MTIQETTVYGGKIAGWRVHAPSDVPGNDIRKGFDANQREDAIQFASTIKQDCVFVHPTEKFLLGTIIHAPGWGPEFAK